MNWAYAHLLLNHFPVLGTLFGLTLLGYAMIRRNDTLKRAALGTFVVVALLALPAYFTGEPAEEVVERAAGISKSLIEAHEDAALLSLIGVELLGLVSLVALVITSRGRPVTPRATSTVLVLSLVTAALMARTANLGGQIHHQEIVTGAAAGAGSFPDER